MGATGMSSMLLMLHIEPVEDVSHHRYRSISMLQCCHRCCRWPYLLLVLMLMLWREL